MKKWVKLGLIIIWIIVIFMFSNESGEKSSNTSDSFLLKVVEVLNLKKEKSIDNEELISKYALIIRKGAHFFAYFVLSILIYFLLSEFIHIKYKIVFLSIFLCMFFSVLDELHQYFVPGRSARIFDVLIDTGGATLGCIINIFFTFLKNKLIKNK